MNKFADTLIVVFGSIGLATSTLAAPSGAVAEIKNAKGIKIGTATLTETPEGVSIQAGLKDLPPGAHGIHIHEKGSCLGSDFKTAGDHFAPHKKSHGLENANGPHAGDLPNVIVAENGKASFTGLSQGTILGKGKNSLFKSGGTAIVIHAKADDQLTDPAGDSGDRIACGVIKAIK